MSLKSRAEKAATPENIAKLRAKLRAKGNAQSSEQLDDIVAIAAVLAAVEAVGAVGSPIQSAIATGRLMASMVRPKRDGS